MSESEIAPRVLKRLGSRPDTRMWRQNTGVARTMDGKRVIRFGIVGGGDYSGILRPFGTRVEIETKSAIGEQSEQQERFQTMIESFGGIYVLAKNENEAEEQLAHKRARLYANNEDLRAAMTDEEWSAYCARNAESRAQWVQTWTDIASITRGAIKRLEAQVSRTPEEMRLLRTCKQSLIAYEAALLEVAP